MTHIFKTTLAGNGGFYGWQELDEKGKLVRQSEQMFASEADAEKAIRTIATSADIIEVRDIKDINPSANTNVNLVRKEEIVEDSYAGMNLTNKSVLNNSIEDIEVAEEIEHPNVAKMDNLDIPQPTEAEKKAYAKQKAELAKKADK